MKTRAFTLLELLIVLLIIGILIAIGLYRYQSVVESGYDTDARAALRAAVINGEALLSVNGGKTYGTSADDIAGKLNAKSDGLEYIAWSNNEPAVDNGILDPDYNSSTPKDILVSIQPGNTMIAYCNHSKSGKYFCAGTSISGFTTVSALQTALMPSFIANSQSFTSSTSTDLATAYCALDTPTGILPRGCGESPVAPGTDTHLTQGDNQFDDIPSNNGWFGGVEDNTGNEPQAPATELLYSQNGRIYKTNENGDTPVDTGLLGQAARYSPQGTYIAVKNSSTASIVTSAGVSVGTLNMGNDSGYASLPSFNAAETKVTYSGRPSSEAFIYTANIDGTNVVQLPKSFYRYSMHPSFSPIADRIAYEFGASNGQNVNVIDGNGNNDDVFVNSSANILGAMYSPDGQYIYYADGSTWSPGFALYKKPVSGGPRELVVHGVGERTFSLSPDGTKLAYVQWNGGRISVVNTNDPNSSVFLSDVSVYNANYAPTWSPDGTKVFSVCDTSGTYSAYNLCKYNETDSNVMPAQIVTGGTVQSPSWAGTKPS